jgi:hypothetical protein
MCLRRYAIQVAVQFADLHDMPGRMKAKGCISDVLTWAASRAYVYWRLRRRIAELDACKVIQEASGNMKLAQV